MSNVLGYKFKTIGHNYEQDEPTLKHTQNTLGKIPNGELPLEMLNIVVKSMMEGRAVVSELCDTVNKWVVTSNKHSYGVSLEMENKIDKLINIFKEQEEYIKMFIFKDSKLNIWIVVEKADYDTSKKYIGIAREELRTDYLKTNVMIYSKDEIEEVMEEINGSHYKYTEV